MLQKKESDLVSKKDGGSPKGGGQPVVKGKTKGGRACLRKRFETGKQARHGSKRRLKETTQRLGQPAQKKKRDVKEKSRGWSHGPGKTERRGEEETHFLT